MLLKSIKHLTDEMLKETRNHAFKIKSKLSQLKMSKNNLNWRDEKWNQNKIKQIRI
jgi:hypothetical protein